MPNRNRGRSYEQETEVVEVLQNCGLAAVRARGSDGRSLGLHQGVDVKVSVGAGAPFLLQCKRQKQRFNAKYKPDHEVVQAQVIREERNKTQYAVMRLQDLGALLYKLDKLERFARLHGWTE